MLFVLTQKVRNGKYRIRVQDIAFIETSKERYHAMLLARPFLDNRLDSPFITGEYGSGVVLLRPMEMQFNNASQKVRMELVLLQEWKTHKNLAKFLGVTELKRESYIVSELSTPDQIVYYVHCICHVIAVCLDSFLEGKH